MAFSAFGQKDNATILSNMAKARDMQLPGLGMVVVTYEDNRHVLASKTGRYTIKGTLQDNWDGVQHSGSVPANYPKIPELLDIDEFAIQMGNPNGKEVMAFVSYSCQSCKTLVEQLLEKEFLDDHSLLIIPVHNSQEDKLVSQQIYCASDRGTQFKRLFLTRDLSAMSQACQHPQPDLNVSLATAFGVAALPATYFKGSQQVQYGPLAN